MPLHLVDPASPLWLYAVLVAGIILLPGLDMAFVLASTLASGGRGGVAALAGIVTGGLVHVALGTLGLGLLLLRAPLLFNALLLAGALYLGWVGWGLWRGASALGTVAGAPVRPLRQVFGRAVATCLLNPKAYLFMVAVFPQFIRVDRGALAGQAIALAAITAVTQVLVYGGVALGAAGLQQALARHGRSQVMLGRGVGLLLMAMAVWTVVRGWQGQG